MTHQSTVRKRISQLATCAIAAALLGCGQNPTANVGTAVLPASLSLDISDFPDDTTNPDARIVNGATDSAAETGRDFAHPHERPCRAAGAILHGYHRQLDRGMALAAWINRDLTDPENPFVEGTIPAGGRNWTYKADFSAFDFDGDDTLDGSGRFDTAPVAIRVWISKDDGPQRFLAALITALPEPEHPGAGALYIQPGVLHPRINADFMAYNLWDRTDSADRWSEAYTVGRLRRNIDAVAGHHRIEIVTLNDDSIQKTVRTTTTINESDFDISEFQIAARTVRGLGVALINTEIAGTPDDSVIGRCISLTECGPADADDCADISTDGMEFLDPAVGDETDWPVDFPQEPTF